MKYHKRRIVTFSENDRISILPEHLIDSIFERLSFQDVVKTSVLSKNWRYKWTRMKALVADKRFSKKFAKNGAFGQNGFIRIINQVLLLHEGPILKFNLYIPNVYLDSFQEIDRWILLLSRKSVRDLTIVNSNLRYQRYKIPSYLFSFLELRNLKLVNCIFKPLYKLQEFVYLKDLFLQSIDFGANLSKTVINLPQLKLLTLCRCTNVRYLNFKAMELQTLIVDTCDDAMLLRLLPSKSLSHVALFVFKPVENLVRVKRVSLTRMLSCVPKIQLFIISGHLVKSFIAEKIPTWLPHALSHFKELVLQGFEFGDLNQLECALCLLRNSPNLEALSIIDIVMVSQDINYDVEPASNHLEAPDCFDQTLHRLQTVKIESLQGSRTELLLIKLLLTHSPSLKKLTIRPSVTSDAVKRLDMTTSIMQFCRASPKAEVIFVSSNP